MPTILKDSDPEVAVRAAAALAAGQLIIMPTDTVYGIAAALDDAAISKLYKAKRRPTDKAIPVLLATAADVSRVARQLSPDVQRLIESFWPGPLTLVLPKRDDLPARLSQEPTVGVRVPDHPVAQAVIQAASGALAVTSANTSGLPAAHTLEMALQQLEDEVALGIDAGPAPGGAASTVAEVKDGAVHVLRAGPLSKRQLEMALRGS